jgi:hypothetical protein
MPAVNENRKLTLNLTFPRNASLSAHSSPHGDPVEDLQMSDRLTTQKLVSMTVATLAGTMMCAMFAVILFAAGALAA